MRQRSTKCYGPGHPVLVQENLERFFESVMKAKELLLYLHTHMSHRPLRKRQVLGYVNRFKAERMAKIQKFRKFHHWPFSNSPPGLNVTIFNRRHLLKWNSKYRSNPKMHRDIPEFSSSISYMCPGLFISYSASLFESHSRSAGEWGGGAENKHREPHFTGSSLLHGEMEAQRSYVTCSNPHCTARQSSHYNLDH